MKWREPRRAVHVPARMRCGTAWTDVCIKNMSSRGLMAQAEAPPSRGTYIEIRRGNQCIVGRVIWSAGSQFGIRAQDRIDVDAIVNEPRLARRPTNPEGVLEERRQAQREASRSAARRAERSRVFARGFQFCVLAGLGSAGAIFAAVQVYQVLSTPFKAVGEAMDGRIARGSHPDQR